MSFMKSTKGHWPYATTRKQPELIINETIERTTILYLKAMSEAVYLVVQLPNGCPNSTVRIRCYQALTNDGTTDDTEPIAEVRFQNYTHRVQKSEIVLTLAPYLKIKIEVSTPTYIKMWYDYM